MPVQTWATSLWSFCPMFLSLAMSLQPLKRTRIWANIYSQICNALPSWFTSTYSFHQVDLVSVIAITCKTTKNMRMLSCLSPINMFSVSQATYSCVSTPPFKQNGCSCLWLLYFSFQGMQMDVDSSVQVPEFRLHMSAQLILQEHLIDTQRVKICILKFVNFWVMRNQSHALQPSVITEPVAQLSFKGVGLCQKR